MARYGAADSGAISKLSCEVKNMDQATRLKDVVLSKEKIKTIKNN